MLKRNRSCSFIEPWKAQNLELMDTAKGNEGLENYLKVCPRSCFNFRVTAPSTSCCSPKLSLLHLHQRGRFSGKIAQE
jgi:hypothetical protein